MRISGDYHTHTIHSDGRCTLVEQVNAAKSRGLEEIAITDHSFDTFMSHMTPEKFDAQERDIEKVKGIRVLHGVEGNIIGGDLDVPDEYIRKCDVLLMGFHRFIQPSRMRGQHRFLFVNGYESRRKREKMRDVNTEFYLQVMEKYPIDILVHLEHRALLNVKDVCECAAKKDIFVELNVKHLDCIEEHIGDVLASGVKLILGSDAHKTNAVGVFDKVEEFMKKYGISEDSVFGVNGKLPAFKDKSEWKI